MRGQVCNTYRRSARPVLLALAAACTMLCQQAGAANKALALGWQGYADTDLKFSEFSNGSYTIALRFMSQYPNAYQGPMLAENGTGTFFLGQGNFQQGVDNTKLMLRVGTQTYYYTVNVQAGFWHQLALVATSQASSKVFRLYMDGSPIGFPLTVNNNDSDLPSGTLRFGKRTTGKTDVDGDLDAQYYGLLDNVAVFNRQLSDAEIQSLGAPTGNESGLVAGYTFDSGAQPAKLSRPVSMHNWSAKAVNITGDNTDADDIPLPFTYAEQSLPFKPGESWAVQAPNDSGFYNGNEGTHNGISSFSWDFKIAGFDQKTVYPFGSRLAPFYVAGRGQLSYLKQDETADSATANDIEITQGPGEHGTYMHLWPSTAQVSFVDLVEARGKFVALVGHTGTGSDHLHFGVKNMTASSPGRVTFPTAFSNYELQNNAGEWHRVLRGNPLRSAVIRNPIEPGNRYVAIWRNDNSDYLHDEHMEFATFEDYKANYDKIFPQGWRLQSLVANVVDGKVLYNALWRPDTASETQIYGKTWSDYKAKFDALSPDGWRLHILQAYVFNGQVLYNAVWRKEDTLELPLYAMPYATYRALYDTYWRGGWRLHILQSYVQNGQVLYNAVFRPTGGSETQSYGVSYSGLYDRNKSLKADGWRLSIVQGYEVGGQTLYNAVWTPGTPDDFSVYDNDYDSFRNNLDERRAMGWRLYRLDVYHQ